MNQDLLVRSEPRCSHTELTQLAPFHRIEAVNPQQPTTHSMDGKVPNSISSREHPCFSVFPPPQALGRRGLPPPTMRGVPYWVTLCTNASVSVQQRQRIGAEREAGEIKYSVPALHRRGPGM